MSEAAVLEVKRGERGRFAPGTAKLGPGGKKGVPQRRTRELREMVMQALNQAGGVAYLKRCALDPKTASAFLTLVGKTLPLTVNGSGPNGEHQVVKRIEIVVVDAQCLTVPSASQSPARLSR